MGEDLERLVTDNIPLIRKRTFLDGQASAEEWRAVNQIASGAEKALLDAVARFVGTLYGAGALNGAVSGERVPSVVAQRGNAEHRGYVVDSDGTLREADAIAGPEFYSEIERVDMVFRTLAEDMQKMIKNRRVSTRQDLTDAITLLHEHAETLRAAYE